MRFSLKSLGAIAASPLTGASSLLGATGGQNPGDAMLSGIPFIGEGFAAQQAQNFAAQQSSAKMNFEDAQAKRQMDFQERMSNTEVQRRMKDLVASGLNPVLAAGDSASTPGGAMAGGSAASGVYGSGASNSARTAQSIMNLERESAKTQIAKTKADTAVSEVTKDVAKEQKKLTANSAKKAAADARVSELQIPAAKNAADVEQSIGGSKRKIDAVLDTVDRGASSAGGVLNLFNPIRWLRGSGARQGSPSSAKGNYYKVDKKTGEILD